MNNGVAHYFECHWRASRYLLGIYSVSLLLALATLAILAVPIWLQLLGMALCLLHAGWTLPRHILLSHPHAFSRMRHGPGGWELWSARKGWQVIELCNDSLALPIAAIVRFRVLGQRRVQGLCILTDMLSVDNHRRLRVRLKFARHAIV